MKAAHIDDSDKIIIRERLSKKKPKDLEVIEKSGVSMFTERLSGLIGPSYVFSFFVGGVIGLMKVPPPQNRRTTRLLINSYVNNVGKTSARFGNNVGGAILMYLLMGKFLNFLFKEEFDDFTNIPTQNAIFGAMTGAAYKCTRGKRAMVLSSVLGATIGSAYAYAWEKGYLRVKM